MAMKHIGNVASSSFEFSRLWLYWKTQAFMPVSLSGLIKLGPIL
jgi:hypothetical protein